MWAKKDPQVARSIQFKNGSRAEARVTMSSSAEGAMTLRSNQPAI
jgi:hypothetical protein